MTTGEQLDNISTVSSVSALTHLLNPSNEGGDIIIADGILIEQEPLVALTEYDSSVSIGNELSTSIYIEEDDIIVEIIEQTEDEVDVI